MAFKPRELPKAHHVISSNYISVPQVFTICKKKQKRRTVVPFDYAFS